MANLDVAPQTPVKLIRKYKLIYHLSVAQEGVIDSATALLGSVLSPSTSVSKITIKIGNNANTGS
jgi:hypothetical protein